MKNTILGIFAIGLAMLVGCTPSAEQINKTATAIGYAAGLIASQTNIKDDAKNTIVFVLNEVRGYIPADGQSFAEAWTPVIKAKVAEFVAAGKIDAATGELVSSVAVMAAKAVDYMIDIRFSKVKPYEELVRAGASGVLDGFLDAFKPVNDNGTRSAKEYDKEAYEWFKKNL